MISLANSILSSDLLVGYSNDCRPSVSLSVCIVLIVSYMREKLDLVVCYGLVILNICCLSLSFLFIV